MCCSESSVMPWLKKVVKPETAPLFACIGAAVVLCGYVGMRHLTQSPDVRIGESRRMTYRENFAEGEKW